MEFISVKNLKRSDFAQFVQHIFLAQTAFLIWLHALQICYRTRVGLNILSFRAPDGWHTGCIKLIPVHRPRFTHNHLSLLVPQQPAVD